MRPGLGPYCAGARSGLALSHLRTHKLFNLSGVFPRLPSSELSTQPLVPKLQPPNKHTTEPSLRCGPALRVRGWPSGPGRVHRSSQRPESTWHPRPRPQAARPPCVSVSLTGAWPPDDGEADQEMGAPRSRPLAVGHTQLMATGPVSAPQVRSTCPGLSLPGPHEASNLS